MKKCLVLLFAILMSFQCRASQPLEYRQNINENRNFCKQVFNYIQCPPHYQTVSLSHAVPNKARLTTRPLYRRGPISKKIPPINSVFVRGGVDLELIGGQSISKIVINAPYPGLGIKVCEGAIYISNDKRVDCNQNPKPCIKIYMNQLKHIAIAGDSCITGCGLDTYCGLTINHCGSGSLCLKGPIHLVRIESSGYGLICIPNVCSDHIHILASRHSAICLGGNTNLLLARAFQQASIDTRSMHTVTAMIQTEDEALVTVAAFATLRAFASGNSNIYYYVTPAQLLQHNKLSGNVLYMGGCCY